MTAAAAITLAAPEMQAVHLYERKSELLHLQKKSRDRYLHPHLYDWPRAGSFQPNAGLPLLNWHASLAGDVANLIIQQFEAIAKRSSTIVVKCDHDVKKITPFPGGGCRVHVEGAPKDGDLYDAVILSIGFGYESFITGENHSYWTASILSGPIRTAENEQKLLVSGNGDGGLVDFMMAAYNGLDHQQICDFIIGYEGLDAAKALLMEIEDQAWAVNARVDLFDEYRRQILPALPPHMLVDAFEKLRPDVNIWFHTRKEQMFRRDTAIFNRFAAFIAIMADENVSRNRIHISYGHEFVGGVPLSGEAAIEGDSPFTPLYRFLRLGADRQQNLAPFREFADAFKAAAPSSVPSYQPAKPWLEATATARFSGLVRPEAFPEPLVGETNLAKHAGNMLRLRVERLPDGRFSWSGDVEPNEIARVWDDDIHSVTINCNVLASEAGPIVSALSRITVHAQVCDFSCRDSSRWGETLRSFTGRALPGPNIEVRFTIGNSQSISTAISTPLAFTGHTLAAQIHAALDTRLLSDLNHQLSQCLQRPVPTDIGWITEVELRQRMWDKWEMWHSELAADESKRRRFLLLLATEQDDAKLFDDALVRLGPKAMRPHLLRATVFSLAFSSCSDLAFSPASVYPGNIMAPNVTGHATGISWIDGREVGREVATRRWMSRLILLSELRTSIELMKHQHQRLDYSVDEPPRILGVGPGEQSVIVGCDPDFQRAMETGADAVRAYVAAVLEDRAASAVKQLESVQSMASEESHV